jgi:hypothetical protein
MIDSRRSSSFRSRWCRIGGARVSATISAYLSRLRRIWSRSLRVVENMITEARRDGTIRTDLDPTVTAVLIGESAFAIARSSTASGQLVAAYITVVMDGLRPR